MASFQGIGCKYWDNMYYSVFNYSRDTHQYLATPTIIEGVIDACHTTRPEYKTVREKHLNAQLLK